MFTGEEKGKTESDDGCRYGPFWDSALAKPWAVREQAVVVFRFALELNLKISLIQRSRPFKK